MSDDVGTATVQRYDPFDGGFGFGLATRVGNLVYTSGMVGVDADFNVPEDPADEFRLIFENLAGVLEVMGTSLDNVVDSTEFVAGDIEALFPILDDVKKEVFAGHVPASTCVCVKRLLDARYRLEVKLVAVVPET